MNMEELIKAVIEGDAASVATLVQSGLKEGLKAETILIEGLTPGMSTVGDYFHEGKYFLPEMLFSAKAMNGGLKYLEPILSKSNAEPLATIVIGSVKGDLHDIGKNIVAMIMKGAGYKVIDIGIDVPSEVFLKTAVEKSADAILLSALLTTTMPAMEDTVRAISEYGIKDKIKVLVGGAPITPDFADQIGADGYAEDAPQAAKKVSELLGLG
ncbi:MAG: corrinoid protein [Desulfobacterales bacterium]|nr:corrinoid protein [Desulfobacterales bacterium]